MRPVRTLQLLFVVNVIILYIAIREYGEYFRFWADPLSYLGGTVTTNGSTNAVSQRIFDLDMLISAIIVFVHGLQLRELVPYPGARMTGALSMSAAVGFCLAMSPHNLPVWGVLHAVGAGTFVASLWIVGLVHLAYLRGILRIWCHRLLMVILTGPLLVYAALYTVQDPLNFAVQKVALVSLAGALLISEGAVNQEAVIEWRSVLLLARNQ